MELMWFMAKNLVKKKAAELNQRPWKPLELYY